MKKSLKKMTLSRETLRHLSAEQVRQAAGGLQEESDTTSIFLPPPITGDSKRACCV